MGQKVVSVVATLQRKPSNRGQKELPIFWTSYKEVRDSSFLSVKRRHTALSKRHWLLFLILKIVKWNLKTLQMRNMCHWQGCLKVATSFVNDNTAEFGLSLRRLASVEGWRQESESNCPFRMHKSVGEGYTDILRVCLSDTFSLWILKKMCFCM